MSKSGTRQQVELEAASKMSHLMQSEWGLRPADAWAEIGGGCLTITLTDALTPIGQIVSRTENGNALLQGVYEILYAAYRDRSEALIARIAGRSVPRSRVEVDSRTGSVALLFFFD